MANDKRRTTGVLDMVLSYRQIVSFEALCSPLVSPPQARLAVLTKADGNAFGELITTPGVTQQKDHLGSLAQLHLAAIQAWLLPTPRYVPIQHTFSLTCFMKI